MERRAFLSLTGAALGAQLKALADTPIPSTTLGKSGLKVTKITLGGYHMRVNGEENAIKMIHRAIDLGITFLDSAHKYHNGESDISYGKALQGGLRKKVILMTKAEHRTREAATKQLEESLTRLKTDYLDLWQCHEVVSHEEVDKILAPGGSLEAFVKAKKDGKVRHIGFTGHADPSVHLRLLESYDGWETIQHPVNLIDQHYLSFIDNVLPRAGMKGLGRIGMKSNAIGNITKNRIASIPECLRFAWSHPIDTLVSGVQTIEELEQNVVSCKTFQPMSFTERHEILARTRSGPTGSKIENYKKKEFGAMHRVHRDGEPA